jgi:hypothetical protein
MSILGAQGFQLFNRLFQHFYAVQVVSVLDHLAVRVAGPGKADVVGDAIGSIL